MGIIGVDLDEVLADTIQSILEYHNYTFCGKNLYKEDISNYHLFEMEKFKGLKQETIDFFNDFLKLDQIEYVKPISGAYEKLKQFKDLGYELDVITARPSEFEENTYRWLEYNFPDIIDEVYFTNHFFENQIKKSDVCKNLGVDLMIEDSFEHAMDISENGIKTFLLDKPWNSNVELGKNYIEKIYSWNELSLSKFK